MDARLPVGSRCTPVQRQWLSSVLLFLRFLLVRGEMSCHVAMERGVCANWKSRRVQEQLKIQQGAGQAVDLSEWQRNEMDGSPVKRPKEGRQAGGLASGARRI